MGIAKAFEARNAVPSTINGVFFTTGSLDTGFRNLGQVLSLRRAAQPINLSGEASNIAGPNYRTIEPVLKVSRTSQRSGHYSPFWDDKILDIPAATHAANLVSGFSQLCLGSRSATAVRRRRERPSI